MEKALLFEGKMEYGLFEYELEGRAYWLLDRRDGEGIDTAGIYSNAVKKVSRKGIGGKKAADWRDW